VVKSADKPSAREQISALKEIASTWAEHSDAVASYLSWVARFTKYSPFNQQMVRAQMPQATLVATYRSWQERGRQVRKGESSAAIFTPFFKDEVDASGKETGKRYLAGYGRSNVFDVSQTDPLDPEHDNIAEVMGDLDVPEHTLIEVRQLLSFLAERVGVTISEETGDDALLVGVTEGPDGRVLHVNVGRSELIQVTATLAALIGIVTEEVRPGRYGAGSELKGNIAGFVTPLPFGPVAAAWAILDGYGVPGINTVAETLLSDPSTQLFAGSEPVEFSAALIRAGRIVRMVTRIEGGTPVEWAREAFEAAQSEALKPSEANA